MANETTLLCKDCKHSFMSLTNRVFTLNGLVGADKYTYKCRKAYLEEEVEYDPIVGYGKTKPEYQSCIWVRREDGKCGPDGKLWVNKRKKDLFKMLIKESYD
jgi:hypothetical protein